jgi:hypothetical protein
MAIIKEYALNLTTAQAQANIEELNASFRAQEALIESLKAELNNFEQKLTKTSKTELAARKSLNEKIGETKTKLVEEKDGLKNVTKERKAANKELKTAEQNTAEYSGVLDIVDGQIGGAISGLTGLKDTVLNATKGFNAMKIAIIGTGIGALIIALAAVGAAFTGSEEGQEKFNKLMAVISAITQVFIDRLGTLGEFIIRVFTEPVEVLKDFGKIIQTFVMDKINKVIDGIFLFGSAIKKAFSGDFKGALNDAGKGFVKLNQGLNITVIAAELVVDSVKAITKASKELQIELIKEAAIAAQISDARAEAARLDRDIVTERAEADLKRATLLNQAIDKEKFTLQERIEFLKEAGRIEDEITAKEIKAAQLRLDAKILENKQTTPTSEALNEAAELQAALTNLTTGKLLKEREVSAQIQGLKVEAAADELALETRKAEAIESIRQGLIDTESEKRIEAKNLIKLDYDEKIKLAEEFYGKETETVLLLRAAQKLAIDEQQKVFDDEDDAKLAEASTLAAEKLALDSEEETLSFDEQRELLAERERLLNEDLTISDEDRLALEKTFVKRSQDIADEEAQYKENQYRKGFNDLQEILSAGGEKMQKVGKALAIADVVRTASKSVSETISNVGIANAASVAASPLTAGMPFVAFNTIKAGLSVGATVAGAAKSISAITADSKNVVKPGNLPPAGAPPAAIADVTPEIPAFNVVGASETNQLADAIGGQSQEPIQAFVVSGEVTTSQELERNIVTGATIG